MRIIIMAGSNADEIIALRVSKEFKDRCQRRADEDRRALSNWIVVQIEKILEDGPNDAPPPVS